MTSPTRMPVDPEQWPYTPPAVGEMYVNTATDRVCVVQGWEAPHRNQQQPKLIFDYDRFRRVKVQYLDTGVRTKIHLYRWEPWDGRKSMTRMVRVRPQWRVTRMHLTLHEWRAVKDGRGFGIRPVIALRLEARGLKVPGPAHWNALHRSKHERTCVGCQSAIHVGDHYLFVYRDFVLCMDCIELKDLRPCGLI